MNKGYRLRTVLGLCILVLGFVYNIASDLWAKDKPEEKGIVFHYEDKFSSAEKQKLETWLIKTTDAVREVLGVYPFDVHYYLNRSDRAGEPVPWAHTERSEIQGVHFHVNPEYSLEEFVHDWTAPHEISHLAIPFVGKSNSWFSEGFATYMQNEVLMAMNEMTEEEVIAKYNSKLKKAYPHYQSDEAYKDVAMELRKDYRFPEMYWGGAYFFYQLDREISEETDMDLCKVLVEYQSCCRMEDDGIEQILTSFDQISKKSIAIPLLKDYSEKPAREIMTSPRVD